MKLFGFEIGRAKGAADIATRPQYTPTSPQGPLTAWFQDYHLRKVSGDFYEAMREGIPVIDSAIRRLISLDGTIKIIGDNPALVKELEDFSLHVPVNDHQKGIHAFLENCSNEKFEQGFSLPEFVATKDMKDIAELRVPDSKQIFFRRTADGRTEPWYRYVNTALPSNITRYQSPGTLPERLLSATYNQAVYVDSGWEVKLDPSNKLYFSINNENTDPYGVSLMRSMEFCAQILMTIQNTTKNSWERFGDPSLFVKYKTNKRDLGGVDLEARRQKIQTDVSNAFRAKRKGHSSDFVTAVSADADMTITVIGADNQILAMDIPARHVLEQIVSKTGLPPMLFGFQWSTGERPATLQIEAALQDAKIRQLAMLPEFIRLFSAFLRLRGRSWKSVTTSLDRPGDWGIIFETPNLRDLVAQAQARFLNAQADQMNATAAINVPAAPTPPKKAAKHAHGCACGCKSVTGVKELERPVPWPQLDAVETRYEDEVKATWSEMHQRVMTVCKLDNASIALAMGQRAAKAPEDLLPETFTLSSEQRAAIMEDLKGYIGQYVPDDPNSPLRSYYGESYSLGLIQAAEMVGAERPILDILNNRGVYEELVKNGFDLLKDNATKAIVNKIIPEMEAHMLAGSNPLSVSARLKKLFGDQNSNWERLARTEMAISAETAKKDEWGERGVDVSKTIIAGRDTHPHCRCANTVKEIDGKLVMAFTPAPDACPICQALRQ